MNIIGERREIFQTLALSLLATAPLHYLNVMAVFVSTLEVAVGFSTKQAGVIASLNLYAAAASSLVVALSGRLPPWRLTLTASTIALVVIECVSAFVSDFTVFCVLRVIHGLVAGILAAVGMLLIARTRVPDRVFAIMSLVQVALAGAGSMILPGLVERHGPAILFLALAILTSSGLLCVPMLKRQREPTRDEGARSSSDHTLTIGWLALLALFVFQSSKMTVASHLFEIGRDLGHSAIFVGYGLGVAYWGSVVGPIILTLIGLRFGRLRPILLVMAIALLDGAAILSNGQQPIVWVLAGSLNALSGSLVVPLLYGLCATADAQGRTAIWSTFCSKLGLATGPALGGILLTDGDYRFAIIAAMVGAVLCALFASVPARRFDRRARDGEAPASGPAATVGASPGLE